MEETPDIGRRRFVTLLGAGTALGLSGGVGSAAAQESEPVETFELVGKQSGWEGVAPERIAGTKNPTLEMSEVGETYRIEWENGDGLTHNLAVRDESSDVLVRSSTASNRGRTVSIEFEATEAMDHYLCEPHPSSMRGDVIVGDPRERRIEQLREEADYVFDGLTPGWEGLAPSSIEGATNPTVELEAGEEYTFGWINGDGQPHNIAIRDADGTAIASTEIVGEENATQTLTFEASAETTQYVCEVHPTTMIGEITVTGLSTPTPTATATEEPTPTATEEPTDTATATEESETTSTDSPGFGGLSALVGVGAGAAAAARRMTGAEDDEE